MQRGAEKSSDRDQEGARDVEIEIRHFVRSDGGEEELLYRWTEGGATRHALTRVPWIVSDTAHDRAREIQEFERRKR